MFKSKIGLAVVFLTSISLTPSITFAEAARGYDNLNQPATSCRSPAPTCLANQKAVCEGNTQKWTCR